MCQSVVVNRPVTCVEVNSNPHAHKCNRRAYHAWMNWIAILRVSTRKALIWTLHERKSICGSTPWLEHCSTRAQICETVRLQLAADFKCCLDHWQGGLVYPAPIHAQINTTSSVVTKIAALPHAILQYASPASGPLNFSARVESCPGRSSYAARCQ